MGMSQANRNLRTLRTQSKTPVAPCRVLNCKKKGHGKWCREHTPSIGAGILRCERCGKPYATHSIIDYCTKKGTK